MRKYHIHITSEDVKAPRGFKLTSVILEKRKMVQEHNMFTQTYVGTGDVQKDVNDMVKKFKDKFKNIQRFKIELLQEPNYLDYYTDKNYREIHIKLKIQKDLFNNVKNMLKTYENNLGYSLSNNPKEVSTDFITQFVNMRYMNTTFEEANKKIDKIKEFLILNKINIIEIKEEISIFDTNFELDKWWTE